MVKKEEKMYFRTHEERNFVANRLKRRFNVTKIGHCSEDGQTLFWLIVEKIKNRAKIN